MAIRTAGGALPAKTSARSRHPGKPGPQSRCARDLGRAEPPSLNVRTAIAAVDDPYTPGARIQATVHRNVDPLENELSRGRISEAAYQAGRRLTRSNEAERRCCAAKPEASRAKGWALPRMATRLPGR
jgi:hypothetical protein